MSKRIEKSLLENNFSQEDYEKLLQISKEKPESIISFFYNNYLKVYCKKTSKVFEKFLEEVIQNKEVLQKQNDSNKIWSWKHILNLNYRDDIINDLEENLSLYEEISDLMDGSEEMKRKNKCLNNLEYIKSFEENILFYNPSPGEYKPWEKQDIVEQIKNLIRKES